MITIISSPTGKPSVQDDLWHIVDSDNKSEPDFKYVAQVFSGSEELALLKFYPDPSTGKAYFNPSETLKQQFSYSWFQPEDKIYLRSPNPSGEMSLQYQMRFGEDFSGLTSLNDASGSSVCYNWRPPLFKRRVNDISQFDNKFVTSRPWSAKCGKSTGEKLLVGYHTTDEIALIINKYGYDNTLISGNNDNVSTPPGKYGQLNISPAGINGQLGSTFIDSNVMYYTVQVDGTDNIFRVDMVCDHDFQPVQLHFMNAWGMFDTARFGLVSRLISETQRKSFTKRGYSFGSSSVDYYNSYGVYNETKINHSQRTDYNYKITMDAPTDQEYQWLSELFDSPIIYAEIDGYFYPVTIKDTNYEFSTYLNNRLRPLEIEIELNQTRYGHAR